jgi:hypothetical protein
MSRSRVGEGTVVTLERADRAEHVDVRIGGWTVVRLTSDLGEPACSDLEHHLRPMVVRGARIAIDLRRSLLHRQACPDVLRSLQAAAREVDAELVVVEADPVLRAELVLAGVCDVHASLDAAVHHGAPELRPVTTLPVTRPDHSLTAHPAHGRWRQLTDATHDA